MLDAARLPGRTGSEWALLGLLLAAGAVAALASDGAGGGLLGGYVALSWLFLIATAAYWVHLYMRHPERVDLWTVSALFAAVFFSASGISGLDDAASGTRLGFAVQALLLLAFGLSVSRVGFLLVCRPGGAGQRKWMIAERIHTTRPSIVLLAAGAVWTLRLYAASQGLVLSHAGDVMTEVDAGASMAIQAALLGRPLVLFLGAVLVTDRRHGRRGLGLVLTAAELLYAVLWARRLVLDVIVAVLLVGLWAGRRLRLRQIILYGVVILATTLVMWPFMFHLRKVAEEEGIYGTDYAGRVDRLIDTVIPTAISTFDLGAAFDPDSSYRENVRDRSRTLDLLLDVMSAHGDGVPWMQGDVMAAALVATVPRVVWPGKEQLMSAETWQVEELIERHFGLPLMDMASTVLTHGCADGGVIGVGLYMALMGVLLGICEQSLASARCALVGLFVYGLGVSLAVQVEANVTDLLAVGRVILVLMIADLLAGRFIERQIAVARRHSSVRRPVWA